MEQGTYSPYVLIPKIMAILVNDGLSPSITGDQINTAAEAAGALLEAVGVTADWPNGEGS